METGHLDRVAHGVIGKDIVAACNSGSDGGDSSTSSMSSGQPGCDDGNHGNRDQTDSIAQPGEISISQVAFICM